MPSIKALLAASTVTFAAVNAHMILLTPPPYGNPDSSPLLATGGDFPCKNIQSTGGQVTEMAIGSSQQLSFKGSAVHGGGSCQVSLTTDANPTKQSKWQVIYSVMGGCPSKSAAGNLPENPDSTGSDKYDYKIPAGITPGSYVLAWTWFNKIGNREMYMNCANVKITGGSSKRDSYPNATMPTLTERDTPSFPNMFVAQIPTTACEVAESTDAQFPDPGQYVDKFGVPSALKPPTGAGCSLGPAAASGSGGSGGSTNAGASGGSGSATSSGGAANSGSSPDMGMGGGTDGSAAAASGSSASPAATSVVAAAAASPAAASPSSASPPPVSNSSTGSSSSGSPSTSTSCTSPGQSICSPDGKQRGTCDATNKVAMIPVPEGTVCKGGLISWPRQRRSFGHVRRQHSLGKWSF